MLFQDLPKTSYFKLIDIWLLFSLNLLIVILVIHTIMIRTLKKTELKTHTVPNKVRPESSAKIMVCRYLRCHSTNVSLCNNYI